MRQSQIGELDHVSYTSHPGARPELGKVVELLDGDRGVRVLFLGDRQAKLVQASQLRPVRYDTPVPGAPHGADDPVTVRS